MAIPKQKMVTSSKKDNRIAVGVIGTGDHITENLLPALSLIESFKILAVSSRTLERAERYARIYHAPIIATDWREIVDKDEIEAVVIAAPPEVHQDVLEYALMRRTHVFVEKPPARDLPTLLRLIEQEKAQHDIAVFVDFNFVFSHALIMMQDTLKLDGEIRHARIRFLSSKPRSPMWGYQSIERSYMFSVGIHAVAMVLEWFGIPIDVRASKSKIRDGLVAIDVVVRFEKGKTALLELGNYSNRFEPEYEFVFESGAVCIVRDQTELEIHGTKEHRNIVKRVGPKGVITCKLPSSRGGFNRAGYENAFRSFAGSILTGNPSPFSLQKNLAIYNTVECILNACE
jgi:predicted dehydrogenase